MRTSTRLKWVAAIGAVVTAAGGVAVAQTEGSGEVVYACVHNVNRQVRIVDEPGCLKTETQRTWNEAGPQGAQGDAGVPGEPGPQGETGPAGLVHAIRIENAAPAHFMAGSGFRTVLDYVGLPAGRYVGQATVHGLTWGTALQCDLAVFSVVDGVFSGDRVSSQHAGVGFPGVTLPILGTFELDGPGTARVLCSASRGDVPTEVSVTPRIVLTPVTSLQTIVV